MTFDEFSQAVNEVEDVDRRAKAAVQRLARIARNRLRVSLVDAYTLSVLKRELRDWDMARNRWRTS